MNSILHDLNSLSLYLSREMNIEFTYKKEGLKNKREIDNNHATLVE